MESRDYLRKRVKIPLKCWAHEDEGVRWLVTRGRATNHMGFHDEHHPQFALIPEVQQWLYEQDMWYENIYPNGYTHADLMFKTRLQAIKFALAWL